MGLLTSADKEHIKIALPKSSNKVIDVAVARLYVAYPDPNQWKFTGLSGAIALVDDLVGHSFFLKLVDIKGHNGVLWDQELYVNFEYYQDRTFFHTFEIEDCFVGLLFEDLNEATHFLKRVQKRERYGSKKTLSNKNATALSKKIEQAESGTVVHGPRGESLIANQRARYNYNSAEPIPVTRNKAPPPPPPVAAQEESESEFEPDYESEDENQTSDWTSAPSMPTTPAPPTPGPPAAPAAPAPASKTHPMAAPPMAPAMTSPPASTNHETPASPQAASAATAHKSNNPFPFPVPVPANPQQSNPFPFPVPQQQQASSAPPFPMPGAAQQYGQPPPQFGQPPQNTPRPVPSLPNRNARAVPPPPPRSAMTPGARSPPPLPPSRRGPVPPPPPHRNVNAQTQNRVMSGPPAMAPTATGGRPPAPPSRRGPAPPPPPRSSRISSMPAQAPMANGSYNQGPAFPPTPPTTFNSTPAAPTPPPFMMQQQTAVPPPPAPPSFAQPQHTSVPPPPAPPFFGQQQTAVPPPPPPPSFPQQQSTSAAPPPPPPSFLTQSQAPAAPAPPPMASGGAMAEATGDTGRDALLASIRGAGGIHALKKVDKSQLDKPSVLLQEAKGETPQVQSSSGPPGAGGGPASLADALAAALNKRKTKVGSDEFDDGDDW